MKKYILGFLFLFVAIAIISAPVVKAEEETLSTTTPSVVTPVVTSNISSLLEILQSLMKQVEDLQKQLASLKTDIKEQLKDGLHEGVSDSDVKKIQELLASDPTLYPRGIISGYYGPLTKEAVKNFQRRHELNESGEVDSETKALMLEYFKEKSNGKIPPGLLRAPGIDKKMRDRLHDADDKDEMMSGDGMMDDDQDMMNDDDESDDADDDDNDNNDEDDEDDEGENS